MKKIVINDCFGGFSLSMEAQKRYLELIGKKAYFFKNDLHTDKHEPYDGTGSELFVTTFTVSNPDDHLRPHKEWREMDQEERITANKAYEEISFSERDLERDDPLLIKVVEELGDKADGRFAKLKIVEIPDDVDWEIDEYDGSETVEEKHRSWS